MARSFKLPDLGEGIHEAEIQEVLVSPGDEVEEGDPILVVETDKAAVDVPSPYTGSIKEIKVEPGDLVNVGDLLVTFSDGEEVEPEKEPTAAKEAEAAEAEEEAEDRTEAEVEETAEEAAAAAAEAEAQSAEREEPAAEREPEARRSRPVPASPATRRLARELEVGLRQVPGSGPGGRVTAEDVRAFAEHGPEEAAEEAEAAEVEEPVVEERGEKMPALGTAEVPPLPDFTRWGAVERQPLRSVRRVTAQKMAQSWSQIPHVSHQDTVDVTELDRLRQQYKEDLELDSLTLTAFVMKAAVAALKEHPRFNASLDVEAGEMVLKQYYHLGVAVDTDRGLIVPVIRDVDQKSVVQLAGELQALAQRTREGEATLGEMQGGTFTITNIGALGGTTFNPIIHFPQVAILGTARASWQPVVRNGHGDQEMVVEPRFLLPLILTFDHRVVDGADAARFTNMIVDVLEDPNKLMLMV
jgi:pyruvate dehydrogenase E2 component (dihydrolipoamide acetyltransferase)